MAIRLNSWGKAGYVRIYVNNYPGAQAPISIRLTRGRVAVECGQELDPDEVLAGIVASFSIPPHEVANAGALYARLEAIAAQPAARASAGSGQAYGRGRGAGRGDGSYNPSAARFGAGVPYGRDLCFENIENEHPVLVEVDHREPEAIDAMIARAPNTEVRRLHLPLGDFRINGRILVERKSVPDFAGSVQSAHLFDQAQRMSFDPQTVGFVIIEGNVFGEPIGMLASAITGAISCLSNVQGMNVFQTLHLEHTAYVVAKIGQHDKNGLGYELPLRKDKAKALIDAQRYVLEGVNGISAELANELLRHFGSLRAVFSATESQLKAVKGMGPKRIKDLLEVATGGAPGK